MKRNDTKGGKKTEERTKKKTNEQLTITVMIAEALQTEKL